MGKRYQIALLATAVVFLAGGLLIKKTDDAGVDLKNGQVAGQSTNLLTSRYPQLPLYPKSTIVSLHEKEGGVLVSLEADAEGKKVQDFYQESLRNKGWQGEPNIYDKDGQSLSLTLVETQNNPLVILIDYSAVPTK